LIIRFSFQSCDIVSAILNSNRRAFKEATPVKSAADIFWSGTLALIVNWFGNAYGSSTGFFGFKAAGSGGLACVKGGCERVGFLTVYNTGISREDVLRLLGVYKAFFKGPNAENRRLIWRLLAQTVVGARRGQSKSALMPTLIIKKYLIVG
jgi:hypothetical protein